MSYGLEDLAADCRAALTADPGPQGREAVRRHLERALGDRDFVAAHLGPDATGERRVLYEDPHLGFCICAHVYAGAKRGQPHDHGPTWAIYGQAEGVTEMTDWRLVSPPENGQAGRAELVRRYRLEPGQAHLYEVGAIHAPLRNGPTKLIRIEGKNTERISRTPIEPIG